MSYIEHPTEDSPYSLHIMSLSGCCLPTQATYWYISLYRAILDPDVVRF